MAQAKTKFDKGGTVKFILGRGRQYIGTVVKLESDGYLSVKYTNKFGKATTRRISPDNATKTKAVAL